MTATHRYSREDWLPLSSCAQIDHPHICHAHCAAEHDGYECMESAVHDYARSRGEDLVVVDSTEKFYVETEAGGRRYGPFSTVADAASGLAIAQDCAAEVAWYITRERVIRERLSE